MPAKRKATTMTSAHKAALAQGREQGRAVRAYLEALEQNRPKRGRKRTADSVRKQLAAVAAELPDASADRRLLLLQQRRDLTAELETMGTKTDLGHVEKEFVKAAKGYAQRRRISYATWREAGVPPDVLKRAGISRGA